MTPKHLGPGTVHVTYSDGSTASFPVAHFTITPRVREIAIRPDDLSAVGRTVLAGEWTLNESTRLPFRDGVPRLSPHLSDLAECERAVPEAEMHRLQVRKPEKPEPRTPGPRAHGKAQWKRERFTR